MEQITNKALLRFGKNLKTMSRQNVSLFCEHIFSLQQPRLTLASIRKRTFQITIMIFLLTDFLQKLSNSLLCKLDFCSAAKGLFPSLKKQNNTSSSTTDWWEYIKSRLKKNARTFFENSTTHKNIKSSGIK